jgi:hypothetical protein
MLGSKLEIEIQKTLKEIRTFKEKAEGKDGVVKEKIENTKETLYLLDVCRRMLKEKVKEYLDENNSISTTISIGDYKSYISRISTDSLYNETVLLTDTYFTKLGSLGTLTVETIAYAFGEKFIRKNNKGRDIMNRNKLKEKLRKDYPEIYSSIFEDFEETHYEVKQIRDSASHLHTKKNVAKKRKLRLTNIERKKDKMLENLLNKYTDNNNILDLENKYSMELFSEKWKLTKIEGEQFYILRTKKEERAIFKNAKNLALKTKEGEHGFEERINHLTKMYLDMIKTVYQELPLILKNEQKTATTSDHQL